VNEQVSEYFAEAPQWQQDIAAKLRETITKAIPDHEERLQYGKPHYLKDGSYAAVIHAAKDKISLMLFNADSIEPEKGFIRSMGKGERKTIDISEGQDVDYTRIESLITQTVS
jgi:hypothetical protein